MLPADKDNTLKRTSSPETNLITEKKNWKLKQTGYKFYGNRFFLNYFFHQAYKSLFLWDINKMPTKASLHQFWGLLPSSTRWVSNVHWSYLQSPLATALFERTALRPQQLRSNQTRLQDRPKVHDKVLKWWFVFFWIKPFGSRGQRNQDPSSSGKSSHLFKSLYLKCTEIQEDLYTVACLICTADQSSITLLQWVHFKLLFIELLTYIKQNC